MAASFDFGPFVESNLASGDRSHIPERTREVFEIIEAELRKVPVSYLLLLLEDVSLTSFSLQPPQHRELEKRLNLLFDGLNCETLTPATEDGLRAISQGLYCTGSMLRCNVDVFI